MVTPARAQDKAACAAAYTAGQEHRNSSRFSAARETLSICAQPTCKDWMVAECVQWLEDVERRQPTVVLSAEGMQGELVDIVRVDLEDGTTLARDLDGRALALDPGKHTLTFVARDGTAVSVSKIIAEGQKATQVKAIFEIKPRATAATTQGGAEPETQGQGVGRAASPKGNPWRTGGFIAGGVGIAGLGVGAVFGLIALNKKSQGHCAAGVCDAGTANGIRTAAQISDVGWIAGSVLLAGGAAVVLFGPGKSAAKTGITVTPSVAANGGAMVIAGGFQ
jgi:hypothetical protein